jgi:diguanylate cyclase (GGDEF)-like protein/PAS domain S-box-containing protein
MADQVHSPDDELLLNALMDNVVDSIYFKDLKCRMIRVSRKMAIDLGYSDPEELIGKTDDDMFGEEFGQKTMIDDLWVMETGKPIIGLVESRLLPDNTLNWTSTSKMPLWDRAGNIIGLVGITREINDLKKAELDLQYLATHDMLTKLPNRYLLFDRLEQYISRASREKVIFAVLYVDLDGFKEVNDIHGHDTGDALLRLASERMASSVRKSDTVARMGGDEFVIILEHIQTIENALEVGRKIQKRLELPHKMLTAPISVTASIGISIFPQHGKTPSTLLRAADQAMYIAKREKNTCILFSPPRRP